MSPAGRSAFAALPDLSTVLLLEWCNGGDVEELLRKQASGALAIDEAAYQAALPRFIAELLTPLALLHGSGSSNSSDRQPCVHLDVKLLNYFGVIEAASQSTKGFDAARLRFKLGDFGTADVGDGSKQVEVKHYTTLENLSPEMYVLGDAVALVRRFIAPLCSLHASCMLVLSRRRQPLTALPWVYAFFIWSLGWSRMRSGWKRRCVLQQ